MPQPPAQPLATLRDWIGLAVIALPCMVYAMDLTVLNLAVPAISAELQPSNAQLLWTIDIYGFMVAGFLITMGTLGDRIGRRRLLLIGAAAFALASALAAAVAAYSRSIDLLILMRALLGVAGATLAPSTMSLIRNMFHDGRQRQFAIGVWIAAFSFGSAIGPLVGGLLIAWFHWSTVFLLALPVMALLLLLGPRLLPEYKDPQAGALDLRSVLLSLAAVLAMVYGLKRVAEQGLSLPALAAIAAGLLAGTVFVRRQRGLAYPLLDMGLFRSARFSAAIAAYGLCCLAMFGVYLFITQQLQLVLALSPLQAGLATLPWGLSFMLGSLAVPLLLRHLPALVVMVGGLLVGATGFALLLLAHGAWALPALVLATVVMSLGLAPVFTLGNEMIITAAPPERAGLASAMAETSSEFSGALGIAVFGSMGTVLYRSGLAAEMPAAVPAEAAQLALATLGGALHTALGLSPPLGAALASAARQAFMDAMQAASLVGMLVVLLAAVLAGRILRRSPG